MVSISQDIYTRIPGLFEEHGIPLLREGASRTIVNNLGGIEQRCKYTLWFEEFEKSGFQLPEGLKPNLDGLSDPLRQDEWRHRLNYSAVNYFIRTNLGINSEEDSGNVKWVGRGMDGIFRHIPLKYVETLQSGTGTLSYFNPITQETEERNIQGLNNSLTFEIQVMSKP